MNEEHSIVLTGIGGQGIQFAATVLATAFVDTGRRATLLGRYTGEMRGGLSEVTIVVGPGPIETPPIVRRCWAAVVLSAAHWTESVARVQDGGLVVADAAVAGEEPKGEVRVVTVPAQELAVAAGGARLAALVTVGAFAAASGLVDVGALRDAAERCTPARAGQRRAENAAGVVAGFGAAP